MRSRYAIANWKMNVPPEGIGAYLAALRPAADVRMVVAPPFPFLKEVAPRATVAGQNCSDQRSGAFTGEVSPAMLRDCGAQFVIVGHSERRNLFGETDALIARKLRLAMETDLTPILCIGEDQKIRDGGKQAAFVADQIKAAAHNRTGEVIIAYEPVWAIGTGRNATGPMVAEMVRGIRDALGRFWPPGYDRRTSILYGGSVTPENIRELGEKGEIDGFLVGGASLDSSKFSTICEGVARIPSA